MDEPKLGETGAGHCDGCGQLSIFVYRTAVVFGMRLAFWRCLRCSKKVEQLKKR